MANSYDTTTKFKVDISQLKSAMQEAKRSISLANSEFKAVSSSMNNWAKSTDGLKAKLTQLDSNLKSQKTILSSLEKQYELTVKEMGEGSAEADRLKIAINNQKAVVNKTEREIKNFESTLDQVAEAEKEASRTGKTVDEVLEEMGDEADKTDHSMGKLSDGFTVMKGALASLVADGIRMAISGLKDMASSVIEVGSNFSSSMAEVQAISGASAEDLALLEKTAREFGATTVFSASESADALKYMALAGWSVEESTSALGGVLNLASASGMELAQASDMVTDYLSAFGLQAKDSAMFADMLAYAQSNSNTSAEQLGEAFKNCSAVLNAGGQDVQTTTALLASMANQGLKGSEAGTALTAMMRDLTAKMKDGKIAIGDTAVTVMDANGNYRDLTDILKDVESATQGMGDAEKATALSATFTADSIKGLNLILNDGVANAESFEEALRNSGGTAEEMSKIMNDNLAGDIKTFQSGLEELSLKIYDVFEPALRAVVQSATDLINGVKGAGDKLGSAIGSVLDTALTKLTNVLPEISILISSLIDQILQTIIAIAPQLTSIILQLLSSLIDIIVSNLPQLTSTLLQLLDSLLSSLIDIITSNLPQLINAVLGMVNKIIAELGKITPKLLKAIVNLIPKLIDVIMSQLPTFLQACIDFLMAIVDALPTVIEAIVTALPQLITSIINGLLVAIPQLIQGAVALLMAIVDAIPVIIPIIVDNLPQIITAISNGLIEGLPILIEASITLFMAIVEAIPEIVVALAKAMPQIITAVITGLAGLLPALGELVGQIASTVIQWGAEFVAKVGEIALNVITNMITFFSQLPNKLAYALGFALATVVTWGVNMLNAVITGIPQVINAIVKFFSELPSKLWTWLMNTITKVSTFISNLKQKATEAGNGFTDKLISAVKDLPNKFYNIGASIVEGIWNGISSGWGWLTNKVKDLANSLLEGAKDALNINSPSKVFRDEVGKWIPAGIAVGIDKNAKTALNSVKDLAVNMVGATSQSLATATTTGGISGGVVNNFTQVINSPKQLSRLDIYRQSKNLLGYAGGGF